MRGRAEGGGEDRVSVLTRIAVVVSAAVGGLALLLGLLSLDEPYSVGGPLLLLGVLLVGGPIAIASHRDRRRLEAARAQRSRPSR